MGVGHSIENKLQEVYNELNFEEQGKLLQTLSNSEEIKRMHKKAVDLTKNPRADLCHLMRSTFTGIEGYKVFLESYLNNIDHKLVLEIYESSERCIREYSPKLDRLEKAMQRLNKDKQIIKVYGKQALWDRYLYGGRR